MKHTAWSNPNSCQFEIDFDHLFQRFEAPFSFLTTLQIEDFLEWSNSSFRIVFFQRFWIIVLIL